MNSSILLLTCSAVLFVLMGIQNNVLSALTPEISAFFGLSESVLDFLYPVSWIVSFAGTVLIHIFFLKYVAFFRYSVWAISVAYLLSSLLTISTFLLKNWLTNWAVALMTLMSNVLFGFVMVTLSISLETVMNNKFTLAVVYKNNGMWSLILLFKYIGWMSSYFVLPLIFSFSMYTFVAACVASSVIAVCLTVFVHLRFEKYTTPKVVTNGVTFVKEKYKALALIVLLNILSNGTWFALLLFLPQNLQFIGLFPQEVIVVGMIGGILLATISWYYTSSPLQWFIVGVISLACCSASTIIVDPSSPVVVSFCAVLLCIGSGGFYSAPYVAAVNLFHNEDVRLAFLWLSASSSLTIVLLSELFAFIEMSPYTYSIYIPSLLYFVIAIYILWRIYVLLSKISPDSFKRSAQQIFYFNKETNQVQDFKEIPQEDHELNEPNQVELSLEMEDGDEEITFNS